MNSYGSLLRWHHLDHLPGCIFQSPGSLRYALADKHEGQWQHDQDPDDHHDPLHHIGPDNRVKSPVGCVDDHGDAKGQQADQVARIDPFHEPYSLDPAVNGRAGILENTDFQHQRLEDQAARLELRNQVKGHEKDNQGDGDQSKGRAAKTISQDVWHRDR